MAHAVMRMDMDVDALAMKFPENTQAKEHNHHADGKFQSRFNAP